MRTSLLVVVSLLSFAVAASAAPEKCKREAQIRAIQIYTSSGAKQPKDLKLRVRYNTTYENKIYYDVYLMRGLTEVGAYGIGLSLLSPPCRVLSVVDLNHHSDWE